MSKTCYFVDASALAKLVVSERSSDFVRELHSANAECVLATTRLAPLEVAAALAQRASRGDIDPAGAIAAMNALQTLVEARYHIQDVTSSVASDARGMIAEFAVPMSVALCVAAASAFARSHPEFETQLLAADERILQAATRRKLNVHRLAQE